MNKDDGWNWAREIITETNYNEWFKEKYTFYPWDGFFGISSLEELISMRNEYMGLNGETDLIKFYREEGRLEEIQKKTMENLKVITLEEYIEEYERTRQE